MTDEAMKAVRAALIDADHLAECSERLLAALNRKAGALERVDLAEFGDIGAPKRAADELEAANEEVSEFWRAVRSATYEYRKRAERARQAMGSNGEVRGASRLAGEASSAEGATSTVVLGAGRPGKEQQ